MGAESVAASLTESDAATADRDPRAGPAAGTPTQQSKQPESGCLDCQWTVTVAATVPDSDTVTRADSESGPSLCPATVTVCQRLRVVTHCHRPYYVLALAPAVQRLLARAGHGVRVTRPAVPGRPTTE